MTRFHSRGIFHEQIHSLSDKRIGYTTAGVVSLVTAIAMSKIQDTTIASIASKALFIASAGFFASAYTLDRTYALLIGAPILLVSLLIPVVVSSIFIGFSLLCAARCMN